MGFAFSETAMKGMEGYVLGLVEDFIGRVGEVVDCGGGEEKEEEEEEGKEKWSKCLNMSQWCNWLVFDIMGELVFGKSFGTLGSHILNRKAIFLLGRAARRNYVVAAMPALVSTGLEKFLPVLRGLYRDRCQYLAFGKQQVVKVMERQQQEQQECSGDDDDNNNSLTKRKDIFSLLLTAQDPNTGDNIPLPELWMESNTLIVAGSDTTSTTLAATLYYLLHNPHTLHRLRAEILATFSTRHEIRMGPKMQSCSYLRAVIDETMRMTPAVGGNLPREVLPGGLDIPELGVFLPEGVDVGVPIYAVQHHADYVVRPFVFDPERWLHSSSSGTGGEKEEQRHHHPQNRSSLQEVFTPFSIGHRSCLGKPLVYMELSLALARLIFAFDMRLSSSSSSSSTSSASASEEEYSEKHAQKEEKLSERIQKEIKSGKRQPFEYQLLDWFMSRNEGPWVEFRWRERERR